MDKNIIYLCVSLPRTGTKSICKMADMSGLKSMHVMADNKNLISYINNGYNFFADTPFYHPVFLVCLLNLLQDKKIKLIYIDRDVITWLESFNRLWAGWKHKPNIHNNNNRIIYHNDDLVYEYLMQYKDLKYRHSTHKHSILQIVDLYNLELLMYNFTDGWKPFCNFIEKDIPKNNIPHIK